VSNGVETSSFWIRDVFCTQHFKVLGEKYISNQDLLPPF
jgi:hypothetical protein